MKVIFSDEFQEGTYVFPEKSLNYFELYEWIKRVKFKKDDILVTQSDYVLKEINTKIMLGELKANEIEFISKWDKKLDIVDLYGCGYPSVDKVIRELNERQKLIIFDGMEEYYKKYDKETHEKIKKVKGKK